MLKRAAFVCAVSSAVSLWAQAPPKIDPSSQPAVSQLAAVAHAMKECPREVTSERQWGKKPTEIERRYAGPPRNVTWDVVPRSSVRSPYLGSIEFTLAEDYWVPDEVKDKFMRSEASSDAESVRLFRYAVRHRYEFDLGPDGLELTQMLIDRRWRPSLDPGGEPKWDYEQPDNTCWQKVARNAQIVPQTVPPGFVAVPVGFATACAIEDSGNHFLSWCDTNSNEATRQACKEWLHGFYTAFYKGLAANTGVACSPEVTDDELFNAVLKYLKDHPGDRDKRTGDLVVIALRQAFPCKH